MNCREYTIEEQVFLALCSTSNSSYARDVEISFRLGGTLAIKPSLSPHDYTNAYDFYRDYCISTFLSKWKGWKRYHKNDTRQAALDNWIVVESACSATNQRLKAHRWPYGSLHTMPHADIISNAREKIRLILGRCKPDYILSYSDWTNGTSFDTMFEDPFVKKLSTAISVSQSAYPHLKHQVEYDHHWSEIHLGSFPSGDFCLLPRCFMQREASRFQTVPKNALIDRCISIEPAGNLFLQKGVGTYITRKLARHGVRKDQTVNQSLAQRAIVSGLATLDLKAASDSVSIETVRLLLPDDWFDLLDSLRTKSVQLSRKAGPRLLNKFSSMGNGFTFELETLIFYAIAKAVSNDHPDVVAFGDDIILPSQAADKCIEILEYLGFTVNQEKSFKQPSRFFESCGKHYFDGLDVTPIYQQDDVGSERKSNKAVTFHNRVLELLRHEAWDATKLRQVVLPLLRKHFNISKNAVQRGAIPFQPEGVEADLGFETPKSWIEKYNPNRGYRCMVLKFEPDIFSPSRSPDGLLAYKLRNSRIRVTPDPMGRHNEIPSSSYQNPDRKSVV